MDRDEYQTNAIAKGVGKGAEYMNQWIDPLHQLLIARSVEGLGLLAKYVQDSVGGLAGLDLKSEPVG